MRASRFHYHQGSRLKMFRQRGNYCSLCGRHIQGCYRLGNDDLRLCSASVVRWARDSRVFACCAGQNLPAVLKLLHRRQIPEIADVIWSFLLMNGRVACNFRQFFCNLPAEALCHGEWIPPSISDRILEYLWGKIAQRVEVDGGALAAERPL